VSKLSAQVFLKVNYFFKCLSLTEENEEDRTNINIQVSFPKNKVILNSNFGRWLIVDIVLIFVTFQMNGQVECIPSFRLQF